MQKIFDWLTEYSFEINWFFIGYFVNELFDDMRLLNLLAMGFDLLVIVILFWSMRDDYESF
jgi:hypothetical protein